MIGVAHNFEEISTALATRAGAEVVRQYGRAGAAAKKVAGWLHRQGWAARLHHFSRAWRIVPTCRRADRCTLRSNIKAQSRYRRVCRNCRICEDACPTEALSPEKQTVRRQEK
ncbi:MAG: 4Fe-4S binding protein [Pseudomonadota bacterium]